VNHATSALAFEKKSSLLAGSSSDHIGAPAVELNSKIQALDLSLPAEPPDRKPGAIMEAGCWAFVLRLTQYLAVFLTPVAWVLTNLNI
jgi:hypothetical protein